jgi:hypothetical protein
MRKFILLSFTISFFISSCSKEQQNSLIGNWRVDKAWRVTLSGKEFFQTGYEDGYFVFSKDGSAGYVYGSDTTEGYWTTGRHEMTWYNQNTRAWEEKEMEYLHIKLIYQLLPPKRWEFHDFHFENDRDRLSARQHNLADTRVYEFIRR